MRPRVELRASGGRPSLEEVRLPGQLDLRLGNASVFRRFGPPLALALGPVSRCSAARTLRVHDPSRQGTADLRAAGDQLCLERGSSLSENRGERWVVYTLAFVMVNERHPVGREARLEPSTVQRLAHLRISPAHLPRARCLHGVELDLALRPGPSPPWGDVRGLGCCRPAAKGHDLSLGGDHEGRERGGRVVSCRCSSEAPQFIVRPSDLGRRSR